MANYFNTINTALRALQVQKKSLDVTGHNIANANTEGYSRQRAVHSTTNPYTVPGFGMPAGAGQVGTGVEISEIVRMRDQFIDGQINEENQALGYWEKKYEGLHRMELIFNEPSDSGLQSSMTKFWESLQVLNNNPEDPAVRETVRQTAQTLVDTFHNLSDQLLDYKKSLNADVKTIVDDINSIGDRIADLNAQIVDVKGTGNNPNDLMDKRDLLFEELNTLVAVQGYEDTKGNLHVSLGGTRLVSGNKVNELEVEDGAKEFEDVIKFKNTGSDAVIESGELRAILDLRGGYPDEDGVTTGEISTYIKKLDNLATDLVSNFNNVHRDGYDLEGNHPAVNFFRDTGPGGTDVDSSNIELSGDILDSEDGVNRIAAGSFNDNPSVLEVNNSTIGSDKYDFTIKAAEMPGYKYTVSITQNGDTITGQITDTQVGTNITKSDLANTTGLITGDVEFAVIKPGSASVGYNPGSGDNAVNLADVINKEKLFNSKTATMLDYFKSSISTLGIDGQRADRMVDNQNTLVEQLNNQRTSISGVSLDEEMANLIQFQQAYNAAAKVINTTNQVLDSLMGIIR